MLRRRRTSQRVVLKVPAEVSAGDQCFKGRTSRVSEKGFFVRSQKSFNEGVRVDIRLKLPDGKEAVLKGIVKYARSVNFLPRQNGMGIELTEIDDTFTRFIRRLKRVSEPS